MSFLRCHDAGHYCRREDRAFGRLNLVINKTLGNNGRKFDDRSGTRCPVGRVFVTDIDHRRLVVMIDVS